MYFTTYKTKSGRFICIVYLSQNRVYLYLGSVHDTEKLRVGSYIVLLRTRTGWHTFASQADFVFRPMHKLGPKGMGNLGYSLKSTHM